jgi:membrane-bound lytic murein transglycosylase D
MVTAQANPGPPEIDIETKSAATTPAAPSYPSPVLASVIPAAVSDTLKSIAGTDAADLPSRPSVEVVTADVGFKSLADHNGIRTGRIQVEVEETLGHYAEWARVRTQRIRNLNRLRFGNPLHLHQSLQIPLDRVTAEAFEQQRYEYHKRLQEDFYATYTISRTWPYRIRRGDSFWSLCRSKFDLPMWLLSSYNPQVDFADLRMDQKIMVPTVELKLRAESGPDLEDSNDSDLMDIR